MGVLVDEHRQPLDVFGQNRDILTATSQERSSGSRVSDSGIKAEQRCVPVQSSQGQVQLLPLEV